MRHIIKVFEKTIYISYITKSHGTITCGIHFTKNLNEVQKNFEMYLSLSSSLSSPSLSPLPRLPLSPFPHPSFKYNNIIMINLNLK